MRKIFNILFSLILLAGCTQQKESIWFSGTFDEAKSLAQSSSKKILIDYFSDT